MSGVELSTAYVSLVVEGSKVAPGVRDALGATDAEASRAGDRAGKSYTSKFGSALKIGAALGTAFAVTKGVQFLGDTIAEATEAQVVTKRTASVIKSMGNVAGISARQVADLAGSISLKAGMDDEAIQSGENMLLTFGNIRNEVGKGNDIFNQATGLMVDYSTVMETDASSAAVTLGKALNDPVKGITALGKAGVQFSEDQKAAITTMVESGDTLGAQKLILGELKKEFDGAAASMATPAQKAEVAWANLKEQIGTQLLPTVQRVETWFSEKAVPAVSNFFDEFSKGEGTAGDIKDALNDAKDAVGHFFDEFKDNEGFGGDVRDVLEHARDATKAAAGYAKDFVGWFNDMPDWAKTAIIGGGLGLALGNKVGITKPLASAGASAAGSLLGKAVGVQKVFETNPLALGKGGPGGGVPGGKVPIVAPALSAGALLSSPLLLAVVAGVSGYFANKVTPSGDKAPASTTPYAEGMPLPGDAFNFGAEGTAALQQAAAMHALLESVHDTLTGFQDLKGAVGGYDAELAKMLRQHPEQGMAKLRDISQLTGASIGQLRDVLPKTSAEISKSSHFSSKAAEAAHDWALNVLGLDTEIGKVDGKKPRVPFEFPGLAGGLGDMLTAGFRAEDVDKKKPTVSFTFPGLPGGISGTLQLKNQIDALHDKTITITTIGTSGTFGGRSTDGRATGGAVAPGRTYMVGERGPELFRSRVAGSIVPNHRLASLSGGGGGFSGRVELVVGDQRFDAYVRGVAEDTYTGEQSYAGTLARMGG